MSAQTRREFLGGVGMSVAAAVALSLAPRAQALPLQGSAPPLALASAGMYPQGDWHVDDICGHLPRYAHPIPYLHDTTPPDFSALVAPVDRQFVA